MEESIVALGRLIAGEDTPHTRSEIAKVADQLGLTSKDLGRAVKFVEEQERSNPLCQLQFTVPGDPPVAKRPRASRIRNRDTGAVVGIRVHAADADDQRSMRSEVRLLMPNDHIPFAGEVELHLGVFRPMLSGWAPYKQLLAELGYIRPDRRPDYDNYAKLLTDAMRGVVFVDDSLVVVGDVSLMYSRRPRLEVVVSGRMRSISK